MVIKDRTTFNIMTRNLSLLSINKETPSRLSQSRELNRNLTFLSYRLLALYAAKKTNYIDTDKMPKLELWWLIQNLVTIQAAPLKKLIYGGDLLDSARDIHQIGTITKFSITAATGQPEIRSFDVWTVCILDTVLYIHRPSALPPIEGVSVGDAAGE
jgi:hypothetical protein